MELKPTSEEIQSNNDSLRPQGGASGQNANSEGPGSNLNPNEVADDRVGSEKKHVVGDFPSPNDPFRYSKNRSYPNVRNALQIDRDVDLNSGKSEKKRKKKKKIQSKYSDSPQFSDKNAVDFRSLGRPKTEKKYGDILFENTDEVDREQVGRKEREDLEKTQQRIYNLENKILELQSAQKIQNDEISRLKGKGKTQDDEIHNLQIENHEVKQANEKLTNENQKVKQANEKLTNENHEVKRANEKLTNESHEVKQANEKLTNENLRVTNENHEVKQANEKLNNEKKQLEDDFQTQELKLKIEINSKEEYKNKLDELRTKLMTMKLIQEENNSLKKQVHALKELVNYQSNISQDGEGEEEILGTKDFGKKSNPELSQASSKE